MQDRLTLIKLIKNSCAHCRKSHSATLCVWTYAVLRASVSAIVCACLRVVALLDHFLHFMSLRRDFGGPGMRMNISINCFNLKRTIFRVYPPHPHPFSNKHSQTPFFFYCLSLFFFFPFNPPVLFPPTRYLRRGEKRGRSSGSGGSSSREERRRWGSDESIQLII